MLVTTALAGVWCSTYRGCYCNALQKIVYYYTFRKHSPHSGLHPTYEEAMNPVLKKRKINQGAK
jgi:hypothetical protein